MDPFELSMSVAALANAIARNLDDDDIDIIAAIFSQLGDTLSTIAIQRARFESRHATLEDTI